MQRLLLQQRATGHLLIQPRLDAFPDAPLLVQGRSGVQELLADASLEVLAAGILILDHLLQGLEPPADLDGQVLSLCRLARDGAPEVVERALRIRLEVPARLVLHAQRLRRGLEPLGDVLVAMLRHELQLLHVAAHLHHLPVDPELCLLARGALGAVGRAPLLAGPGQAALQGVPRAGQQFIAREDLAAQLLAELLEGRGEAHGLRGHTEFELLHHSSALALVLDEDLPAALQALHRVRDVLAELADGGLPDLGLFSHF
mmetsp:Transcript_100503/g.282455  ORF Transcript_100503/g.282455 Transcript_100503/m.282455 type:complete len:259 (+) Transcript_100503:3025-3801(+)